jgi:hypothetical protein
VLIGAIAVTAAVVVLRRDPSQGRVQTSRLPPGPLQVPPLAEAPRTVVELPIEPGDTASIGIFVPAPEGADSLVLEAVDVVGANEELDVVGALVSTGRANGASCVGSSRTYPPRACSVEQVPGWRISREAVRDESFQIVLGLTLDEPGVGGFALVAVRYRDPSSGEAYRALFPQAGQICAPIHDFEGSAGCPQTEALLRRQRRVIDNASWQALDER